MILPCPNRKLIHNEEKTLGSETSQYQKENKSIEILRVVVSEIEISLLFLSR